MTQRTSLPLTSRLAAVLLLAACTVAALLPTTATAEEPTSPRPTEQTARDLAESVARHRPGFDLERSGVAGRGGVAAATFTQNDGNRAIVATISRAPGHTLEDLRRIATHDGTHPSELSDGTLVVNGPRSTTVIEMLDGDGTHLLVKVGTRTSPGMFTTMSADDHATDASSLMDAVRADLQG